MLANASIFSFGVTYIFRIPYPLKIVTTLRRFAGDKSVSSSKGKGK